MWAVRAAATHAEVHTLAITLHCHGRGGEISECRAPALRDPSISQQSNIETIFCRILMKSFKFSHPIRAIQLKFDITLTNLLSATLAQTSRVAKSHRGLEPNFICLMGEDERTDHNSQYTAQYRRGQVCSSAKLLLNHQCYLLDGG